MEADEQLIARKTGTSFAHACAVTKLMNSLPVFRGL